MLASMSHVCVPKRMFHRWYHIIVRSRIELTSDVLGQQRSLLGAPFEASFLLWFTLQW